MSQRPDITFDPARGTVRIYGVVYALEVFKVLASRLPPGTHVDLYARDDGTITLHHHQPGPVRPAEA